MPGPASPLPRFHLAFPVHDLDAARAFYSGVLGCPEGRSASEWVDFDFFGHQIVAHLSKGAGPMEGLNDVDGDNIPVRHFGIVLTPENWRKLAENLKAFGVPFLLEPKLRFQGEQGEQFTLFVRDPSGNALEFKAFQDEARIFAR
jgi:extradiol dioxygenase family protein